MKRRNVAALGPAEVPWFLRQERARLGIACGKFDLAVGPDGPVLCDASKTPCLLAKRPDPLRGAGVRMAEEVKRMVRRKP